MPRNSDKPVRSYADALAAFKRDSRENSIIACVLRKHLSDALVAPVLDIGAGSGELAALAFPDRLAFLLDRDDHGPSANPLHRRIRGDFLADDLPAIRASTIILCHSLYFLTRDTEQLGRRLAQSGARTATVVSNENTGVLKEIADRLSVAGIACNPTFHVAVPGAELEIRIPFSVPLECADFDVLTQHFVRILLDCDPTDSVVAAVGCELHRLLADTPQVQIAEAAYRYRVRHETPGF
jgi:hypothetical protein